MIKLIATDMDGTLLNSKGELPKDFYEVLDNLNAKGILFAAASGRQYFTLTENFGHKSEDIVFMAENGAFVIYKGKEIFSRTLDKKFAIDIIRDARKISGCSIVLCGKKSAYVESEEPQFILEMRKYYHKNKLVTNLELVEDDFLKVALYDSKGSANNSYKIMAPKWEKTLKLAVSGANWLDLARSDVDKGVAIRHIQEKFNIKHTETMVFGDYFNDIQLLENAYHSYVMENAPEEVKKYGRFIAESNDENGVLKVIKNEVLLKEA